MYKIILYDKENQLWEKFVRRKISILDQFAKDQLGLNTAGI